ncbi:hypothetical protein WV31_10665 [Magnetospirillum sp. ME-1]|uniref:hypothetical protein n=1 Tax=Magnetospirillum sp. ME-1 TaxID=1639348 RepID=UPI000A17A5D9|nr:hypothetical protein [Magnetospirillum sp. ME-1]ARJ66089.1 hypothetical protein WV31_10665 [Magnetospirillum sp. ME-1]
MSWRMEYRGEALYPLEFSLSDILRGCAMTVGFAALLIYCAFEGWLNGEWLGAALFSVVAIGIATLLSGVRFRRWSR